MAFELFLTAAADGVAAKAQKNTDKKNLDEAEGDPEEYERKVEKIEKRKKTGDNLALWLVFAMIVIAILMQIT